jgi:tetratricopeptide (TPR) repeat protein
MEPITAAAATAALVMKYLLPEISNLGEQVLEKSGDAASDAAVGFGQRLLRRLLRRRPGSPTDVIEQGIERRVLAVSADPGQQNASIQLEGAIEDLLTADPELLASVRELLDQAPGETSVRQGDGSIFAGRDIGTVFAGQNNTYYAREDPKDLAAKYFSAGEQHLSMGLFREAAEDFRQARVHDPHNQAAYFLGAVAGLDGQKAFRASLQRIREVERLIQGAMALGDGAIYHYFLAYLQYDYYERRSLKEQGSWRASFTEAWTKGVTPGQIDSLFRFLSVENPLPALR